MKYDRNPKVCAEQDETGEKDAIFILEAGATLSNVIIGPNQAEGVHCKGTCTLNNVWWLDVCEGKSTCSPISYHIILWTNLHNIRMHDTH